MDTLTKKKNNRSQYLQRLYEISEEKPDQIISMWEIGEGLGLTREDIITIVDYLNNERLLEFQGFGGSIAITHNGIIKVESILSNIDSQQASLSPVVNVINVENMHNSQIQQGTHSSSQMLLIDQNDLEAIKLIVDKLNDVVENLSLTKEDILEAKSELQTIEAQLKSSKPKISILKESLKTLRNLIEGVAANALAAQVLPLFAPLAKFISIHS